MLSIGEPLLCSCAGYDAGCRGVQRGAGTAVFFFESAQSRGSLAAARARHTISAGSMEANRDKYQRVFEISILFIFGSLSGSLSLRGALTLRTGFTELPCGCFRTGSSAIDQGFQYRFAGTLWYS